MSKIISKPKMKEYRKIYIPSHDKQNSLGFPEARICTVLRIFVFLELYTFPNVD